MALSAQNTQATPRTNNNLHHIPLIAKERPRRVCQGGALLSVSFQPMTARTMAVMASMDPQKSSGPSKNGLRTGTNRLSCAVVNHDGS
jgi:hypothetical protein